MKKRFLTFLIVFITSICGYATHIVGGEFQLIEQRAGLYDIYLNLYFDEINGNPQAEDQSLVASIYRKSDNLLMSTVYMENIQKDPVDYANPDCKISEIETSKITYAAKDNDNGSTGFQFTLDYNDPDGYYIVWDRCCRNDSVVNIETPGDVGMLFYLHFPPIFDSSDELTGWSSPVFTPIPATYACVGEPFNLDFGATDIDGDDLVFSIETPMIGFSSPDNPVPGTTLPEPSPNPYPTVTWVTGIDETNEIPGSPPLSINANTGVLNVTPSQEGLHVFSVKCEEYRSGTKIGEVRRDFQIYVYDNCQQNSPPLLSLSLGDTALYNGGDTIQIYTSHIQCIDLLITDDQDLRNNEKMSVIVFPINFSTSSDLVSPGDDNLLAGPGDTLTGWEICPPNCEEIIEEPFIFDVIAFDDGCPQPKSDTTRVILELIPEPNSGPQLTSDINGGEDLVFNVYEIDTIDISFTGYDPDSTNLLTLKVVPDRFSLKDFGMEFTNVSEITHTVSSDFQWIIDCDKLENTEKKNFHMWFILNDNSCDSSGIDTVEVTINVNQEVKIEEFITYNIFTPNGDKENDDFIVRGLPRDNCVNQYVSFEIYNRWGKKVFESDTRYINWDGEGISDGVYFYVAKYTERSYKGHFTVLR